MSALTGKPFRIVRIRAGRDKPGLRPQHLTAVRALAEITGARVEGDRVGSSALAFRPGPVRPGSRAFDVGTAGAVTLVLQALFLPLALQDADSDVALTGGTHVPWSPSADYLERQWLPLVEAMGLRAQARVERAGFYPAGGGRIRCAIRGLAGQAVKPIVREERGPLRSVTLRAVISGLPLDIARRLVARAEGRLRAIRADEGAAGAEVRSETEAAAADSPGVMLILQARFAGASCCHTALGAKGKRAERVADEACEAFEAFLKTDGTVDEHAADQILLPCALAPGRSVFRTPNVTPHLLTNAHVIREFLDARIGIEGAPDGPGVVRVDGTALSP